MCYLLLSYKKCLCYSNFEAMKGKGTEDSSFQQAEPVSALEVPLSSKVLWKHAFHPMESNLRLIFLIIQLNHNAFSPL